ncbi:MAG: SAM-dependent methyltransferase [Candidatus Eremiobacteraeota bacterium]|nr:SAM-dependent methyltransferase [Candidatus Eremiobacteraeota bacterium]
MTAETRESIERADAVFFLASDPIAYLWLPKLNKTAASLHIFYKPHRDRARSYEAMVAQVLQHVRDGKRVCMVSYGHPGVLSTPLHEAVRQARKEGFEATMQPGISAADCLFADLGVDPGLDGCLIYEATDFLVHKRPVSVTSALVLWQVGLVGEQSFKKTWKSWNPKGLRVLCTELAKHYGPDHEVVIYEAAHHAVTKPRMQRSRIRDLPRSGVGVLSTLYVPPLAYAKDDRAICRRLGIKTSPLKRNSGRA